MTDTDSWLSRAKCRGMAGLFHWSTVPHQAQADVLVYVCLTCPVIDQCRQDLVDSGDEYRYQVRGGLCLWDADQRALLPEPSPLPALPVPPRRRHNAGPFPHDRSPDFPTKLSDQPDEVHGDSDGKHIVRPVPGYTGSRL